MSASFAYRIALRRARPIEFDACGQVMFDAIHATPSPYTAAQRHAWCSAPPSGADWHARLAAQQVWLAEHDGMPEGFATLSATCEIDLAYLRPVLRGSGAFRALILRLEADARMLCGTKRAPGMSVQLTTFASLAAQRPFAALGFTLVRHETVARSGQMLRRALMRKALAPAPAPAQL